MTFFLVSAIIGILLGLRFNVFVLLPATLIAACAIIAAHYRFEPIPLIVFATATLLQIGYVLGCVIRAYTNRHPPERTRFVPLVPDRDNLRPVDHSGLGAAH